MTDHLPVSSASASCCATCTLDDADLLDEWNPEQGGRRLQRLRTARTDPARAAGRGPLRNERNGTLIVELLDSGEPIGTVGWRRVLVYGPSPFSDAWQIGIELMAHARGRGLGTEAQRLLADYLFAATDLNRVEASTDIENVAEQRSLEKAGYMREGVARGSQFRGGAYHDLVYYSRLRALRLTEAVAQAGAGLSH